MHELSLCLNMLRTLEQQAKLKKFSHVKTIWLEIGKLAGVEKEALVFSFPIAAKHTVAEGAQLNIIDIPGQAECQNCSAILNIDTYFDVCSQCGQYSLRLIRGNELRIYEVEVA